MTSADFKCMVREENMSELKSFIKNNYDEQFVLKGEEFSIISGSELEKVLSLYHVDVDYVDTYEMFYLIINNEPMTLEIL